MNGLEALILGIVQGLTEFLPISSSGHLVLFQKFFGVEELALTFDTALHVATLVAVIAVFWKDVLYMVTRPFSKLTLLVVAGTIPTILIGVAFKDVIESIFSSGKTLGFEFILTGLILWYAESVKTKNKGLEKMNYGDAAVIGIAQGIAILPAVSRSGLTIAGALFRGLNRELAARFSLLMSIPAILGAALLNGYDMFKSAGGIDLAGQGMPIAIGMAAAAVSGFFAIKFLLKVLTRGSLKVFSYYVFVLGAAIIAEQLLSGRIFGRLF